MAASENIRERRGEPVVVIDDKGIEREATIEFGDFHCMSFYCERDGHSTGRIVLYDCESRVRSDKGGLRPVWASFCEPSMRTKREKP